MNPEIIHNLDEDTQPEFISIKGKKIDISFIPCGISIPLLRKFDEYRVSLNELALFNQDGSIKENAGKKVSTDKAFASTEKMIEMVSMFTVYKDPEMDKKWIEANLSVTQMGSLLNLLVKALMKKIKNDKDNKEPKKKLNGNES